MRRESLANNAEDVAAESPGGVAGSSGGLQGQGTGLAAEPAASDPALDDRSGPARKRAVPRWMRESVSWFSSLVVHLLLLLILGLWVLPAQVEEIFAHLDLRPEPLDELIEEVPVDLSDPIDVDAGQLTEVAVPSNSLADQVEITPAEAVSATEVPLELSDLSDEALPTDELIKQVGAAPGRALAGRGEGARASFARERGGSAASEKAVEAGLNWLARHQNPDGSWSLDHQVGPCQGRCPHPGAKAPSLNGATSLALLPFLGAGQTHLQGRHKKVVDDGLGFLLRSIKVQGNLGSFREPGGTMYSHGLASIALCEAYAMTQDSRLAAPAQLAVNFIVAAQDPVGGGWRYNAPQRAPGDTSVLGWQLMALKSGHMAYLHILPQTIRKAEFFLGTVQADGGAAYGYLTPGRSPSNTAVGLLCRMYLGWKRDHPPLVRGVHWLSQQGPSPVNLYYNYYATQVLFHFSDGEGELWDNWNQELRDHLIRAQAVKGHAAGSWMMGRDHSATGGGRLYCTVMATMVLEVYYRHLPLYRQSATEEEFPLE